jgi:hypothetical protein
MNSPIDNWTDGLLAIRRRASQARGEAVAHDIESPPRTTGADAILIAAAFDDAVWDHASPNLIHHWIDTLDDLEDDALGAPDEVYPQNRSFWAMLDTLAFALDDVGAPPPHRGWWSAVAEQLDVPVRNADPSGDGPIAHFENIHTYDDLYRAEYQYLCDKRGADTLAPPDGMTGATMPIPRTLNSDVLQLATYWTDALTNTKHEMGYDETLARWQKTLADVADVTKRGAPTDVYAKNNAFWHDLQHVSTQVAVSDEAPTGWEMFVRSVEDSVKRLPETLDKVTRAGESLTEGVGRAAGELGKGLLDGLGGPVVIGAGLLGLYLVTRHRGHDREAA